MAFSIAYTQWVTFAPNGIWITNMDGETFRFSGSVIELLSIMVYHHELNIEDAIFCVQGVDYV